MSRAPAVFASDEHVDPDGHLDRARHHGMSGKIWEKNNKHIQVEWPLKNKIQLK